VLITHDPLSKLTVLGMLSRRYVVHLDWRSIVHSPINRVIISMDFSRTARSSNESVHSANPVFTLCTSFKRVACSPKPSLRATQSAYAPAWRALWNMPRRTKSRVSGRTTRARRGFVGWLAGPRVVVDAAA
jgi:hypothetical protein